MERKTEWTKKRHKYYHTLKPFALWPVFKSYTNEKIGYKIVKYSLGIFREITQVYDEILSLSEAKKKVEEI